VNLRPKFREEHVVAIESFIAHHLRESGRKGLVVGMSGGLDSSLAAKLCVDAVGARKVLGLMLYDDATSPGDRKDARGMAKSLKISFRELSIAPMVDAFRRALRIKSSQRVALGNIKARCRMIVLYGVAGLENRMVIGTSNKSELLTGYFTKAGDGMADFAPLGDLYKTQVREMARFLDLPKGILGKRPTAGLWKGQTDEKELGISYSDLDRVLLGLELQLDADDISRKTGLSPAKVSLVERLISQSVHKRKIPLIPKMGIRTLGLDWRE